MLGFSLAMFFFFLFFLVGVYNVGVWGWSVSFMGLVFREFDLLLKVDNVSLVCDVMLLLCGLVALFYCFHYFGSEGEAFLLYPLMVWFLSVMFILVLSGSVLMTLLLWEYLGLVSFFLILFYSNMSSLRASLVTLFVSRFGDVALFVVIMWVNSCVDFSYFVFGLMVLFVVLTKSACYPFMSWLLEAMRAPTPVSSLVHSSTLVAAGVWYFLCYPWLFGEDVKCVLFIFGIVTVAVSGVCALFFNDLKKLVALSTCNNISWCILFFLCGSSELALLQLITHGVCKCYLFMSVGDLMGLSGGSQSSLGVYLSRYAGVLGVYMQSVLVFSLSGLPFIGVFFSKHELVSSICYVYGLSYVGLLFFGFLLSYAYCVRLVLLLLGDSGGLSSGYSSYFIIPVGLSVGVTLLNFTGLGLISEDSSLSVGYSLVVMLVQILGCLSGVFFFVWCNVGISFVPASLFYSDSLVEGFYNSYLSVSRSSFGSFYRWEFYVFSLWPRMASLFMLFRYSIFSFNAMVLFLLSMLFLFLLLGV